jgi:hypothetical protein
MLSSWHQYISRDAKRQISSTKLQTSSNGQSLKFQTKSLWSFGIGTWNLFGIWNLSFGICNRKFCKFPKHKSAKAKYEN